jgi:uncharacterized membrane protein YdjX (TVP38/TMEM64 family)
MSDRTILRLKLLGVLGVSTAFWLVFFWYRDELTLAALARHESTLRGWWREQPLVMAVLAFVVYVVVTGLSLPGATVMSLMYGWLFGFWPALSVVSIANSLGATLAFLISRFLFHDVVQQQFGGRLSGFNEALRREGAFYLFILRLTPAVPYFVINVVMGLTPLKTWTFWWVSFLGMLPVSAAFVWAGSSVPSVEELGRRGVTGILTPQLLIAFALIGAMPIIARRTAIAWRRRRTQQESQPTVDSSPVA